jgi:hypothetical protein
VPWSVFSIACDQHDLETRSLTSACVKVWCVISKAEREREGGIFITVLMVAYDSVKESGHIPHTTK